MKITAEFNSNEELLSFINTFGASAVHQTINLSPSVIEEDSNKDLKSVPKVEKPTKESPKVDKKEEKKPKVNEEVKQDEKVENKEEEAAAEEEKITFEMVRAVFAKIIKAGKQKEAKELTTKYGASKLPELKEEDYSKILKEAEELI